MIRSFCVAPYLCSEINCISEKLDKKLVNLQTNGWRIIRVIPMEFELWDYPKYHKALKFIILAERKEMLGEKEK